MNKIDKIELKPCPFCGNKDVQMILGIELCEIWCCECKASILNSLTEHFDTLAEAREALEKSTTEVWNRRAE